MLTVIDPGDERAPGSSLEALVEEASRQFGVCNACRYCEDYCAVFPAMELRTEFAAGDLSYIANVCHDCRACMQACMYTEPHPFALDLPSLLTEARVRSYEHYARPRAIGRLLGTGPRGMTMLVAAMVAVVLILIAAGGGLGSLVGLHTGPGAFYRLLPHVSMIVAALTITVAVAIAATASLLAFWRELGGRPAELLSPGLWLRALWEGLSLRWMRGGGGDCYYPDPDRPSPIRRWAHQLLVAGFTATFASTVAAFIYEEGFSKLPPYGWVTLPVELGFWGGVAVLIGTSILTFLKWRNDGRLTTERAIAMDYTLLISLELVAATGIALLLARATPAMGVLLVIHLALVFGLLLSIPYAKLVHAVYRLGGLLRSVSERSLEA